jgi:hypothetical protein
VTIQVMRNQIRVLSPPAQIGIKPPMFLVLGPKPTSVPQVPERERMRLCPIKPVLTTGLIKIKVRNELSQNRTATKTRLRLSPRHAQPEPDPFILRAED